MTREETRTILSICKAEWPQSFRGMSKSDAEEKFNLWCTMFADDDAVLVGIAVKAMIAGNREFAPGVGQIKEKMRELTAPQELSEAEAWNQIAKAIRNSVYESAEEYDKLPPILKRIVGSASQLKAWAMMDSETVHSVVASNVMRSYRAISARERDNAALPESIRNVVQTLRMAQTHPQELHERKAVDGHHEPQPSEVTIPMPDHVRGKLRELAGGAVQPQPVPRRSREDVIAILRGEKMEATSQTKGAANGQRKAGRI